MGDRKGFKAKVEQNCSDVKWVGGYNKEKVRIGWHPMRLHARSQKYGRSKLSMSSDVEGRKAHQWQWSAYRQAHPYPWLFLFSKSPPDSGASRRRRVIRGLVEKEAQDPGREYWRIWSHGAGQQSFFSLEHSRRIQSGSSLDLVTWLSPHSGCWRWQLSRGEDGRRWSNGSKSRWDCDTGQDWTDAWQLFFLGAAEQDFLTLPVQSISDEKKIEVFPCHIIDIEPPS